MSSELFAMWQKMGIKSKGPEPKVEEKKAPAFVPNPVFSNPSPPKQAQVRKTGTDEMKDIMAKKVAQEQNPLSKAQVEKKKSYLDEMKETMAKKDVVNQNQVKPVASGNKKTYVDEMKEIMANRGAVQVEQKPVAEKKMTYLEEMKQTMSKQAEAAKQAEAEPIVIPKKVEEAPVNVERQEPFEDNLKKIDDDSQMKSLKEMLESRIKFAQGDTLELKAKPNHEPPKEEQPDYQAEVEVPVQEQPVYQPQEEPAVQAHEEQPPVEEAPAEYQPPEQPAENKVPVEEAPVEYQAPVEEAPVEYQVPVEEAPAEYQAPEPVEYQPPVEEAPAEYQPPIAYQEPVEAPVNQALDGQDGQLVEERMIY